MLGIIIPLFVYKLIQEGIFLYSGDLQVDEFWSRFVATILGDFISLFGLTIPSLFFLTRLLAKRQLALVHEDISDRFYSVRKEIGTPGKFAEFFALMCLLAALSQTVKLSEYWFIYGSIALYAALRWGIGLVVIVNSFILVMTYLLPSIFDSHFISSMTQNNEMLKIQLGSSLLYVFSTVTGRVMTDVAIARRDLNVKNDELERTNKELDRFVYSVSHDLSAPLKSIQGLVAISLMDSEKIHTEEYLKKIAQSSAKLDFFIKEILDYSRNKRTAIQLEQIPLLTLCEEIIDNLKYMDHFQAMNFDLSEINKSVIYSDRLRLKIIFNNLFSNAIKFQKRRTDQSPMLQVLFKNESSRLLLIVRDNGEGIREEYQTKIFEMFFRANESAAGSGLGLYIAQEAAEKLGGKLTLKSEFGKGSEFILEIPKRV